MKNAPVIIFILIVILLFTGGYFLIKRSDHSDDLINFREVSLPSDDVDTTTQQTAEMGQSPADVPRAVSETIPTTQVVSDDARSYKNSTFRFGLSFPKNLTVKEYKEAGGDLTVTFTDSATGESFQIYATPYGDSQITTERFRLDEPSGVYDSPKEIVVDGTRATMFFSRNTIMGDTREVWFIHGGFLYEVTTYKELDTWLGGIMKTWKFL